MRTVVVLFLLAGCSLPTQARKPRHGTAPTAQRRAMRALSFLEGRWEGRGWVATKRGRFRFRGTERVTSKLGGLLLVIEGDHWAKVPRRPKPMRVHQALAVVRFKPNTKRYVFHAFTAKGLYIAADAQVKNRRLEWGFLNPHLGKVRYTIRLTLDGQWFEEGFTSRRGGPSRKFFEMKLRRLKPAPRG